ncbi:fibroblast growth factor 4A-like [Protopterus annectens]|uniref:fibroblast growth factor 4A-like n=1 Tax=Protopterus annectens TaxID=7888 RepID=UPI001CF9CAAE|nr:fibroblast growth factor 4A-like [Protopterus annectens]
MGRMEKYYKLETRDYLWKIIIHCTPGRRECQEADGTVPLVHPWPVSGFLRHQLLYCKAGIGFHLQILPGGKVGGAHEYNEYCILEVFSAKAGIIGLKGSKSRLYLAMNKSGKLYGSETFTLECLFKEQLEENNYTTYSSSVRPDYYVALSRRGKAKKGGRVKKENAGALFIPRLIP